MARRFFSMRQGNDNRHDYRERQQDSALCR
jgi:hypothetical protein